MSAANRDPAGSTADPLLAGLRRLRRAVLAPPVPALTGGIRTDPRRRASGMPVLRSGAQDSPLGAPSPRTAPDVTAAPAPAPSSTAPSAAVPPPRAPVEPVPTEAADTTAADAVSARELVQRCQGGDAEAFGLLYDRYVDMVFHYVYYRVGSRAVAEDLCSETFLRALRRISSFTWQGRDIGAWFVTIARNLVADHYKSSRYRLEVTYDELLGANGHDPVEVGPEQLALQHVTNQALLEAVSRLKAEQQECIVLRFLQGLSVRETAQVMGKNDGTIKALQYRAVKSLGRLLPAEMSAGTG